MWGVGDGWCWAEWLVGWLLTYFSFFFVCAVVGLFQERCVEVAEHCRHCTDLVLDVKEETQEGK